MTKVLELWETHCIDKTNIIYERYKFNNHSQEQTESIDKYVTAWRALAETCEFGTFKDHLRPVSNVVLLPGSTVARH